MKRLLIFLTLLPLVFGCATLNLEQRVVDLEDQMMMLQASGVGAATRMYGRDCIDSETNGCAKSMDDIPGTKVTGDKTAIWNDDKVYAYYVYDSTSGAAVNYPYVVDDDTQVGDERWLLFTGGQIAGGIQFAVADPENLPTHAGRSTQSQLVWYNRTGVTVNIEEIRCMSDTTGYTFLLFKSASNTDIGVANDTQIDSVVTDTAGTSGYYKVIPSGFDSGAIEAARYLIFEHVSGTAEALHCIIEGYLD